MFWAHNGNIVVPHCDFGGIMKKIQIHEVSEALQYMLPFWWMTIWEALLISWTLNLFFHVFGFIPFSEGGLILCVGNEWRWYLISLHYKISVIIGSRVSRIQSVRVLETLNTSSPQFLCILEDASRVSGANWKKQRSLLELTGMNNVFYKHHRARVYFVW